MRAVRVGVVMLAVAAIQCGGPTSPTAPGTPEPARGRTAVLIGAGDIGMCDVPEVAAVGRLVEATAGDLFLAGDIAYPHGRAVDFHECFEPFWAHARERWHATPGNHEYESPGAVPYFQYFGAAAGPPGLGYHHFAIGEWLVLMLNSEIPAGPGSPQYEFVREVLRARRSGCQLAIWHRPLFSSGPHGSGPAMRELWRLLDAQDVDVVVSAHDHLYERFSPQDADGRFDAAGVRQFTVGTGGATLYSVVRQAANSEERMPMHGIVRFTLRPDFYNWEFLALSGAVADLGFGSCR